MALKIYGVARSRAFRTLWMAKELGLDYEHIKVDFATGETRRPEHLALNPNGHVPVIDDDGFILWESMAINLYLAKKYGRDGLYPSRLEDEARAWQWSFWGMTEVERPVLTALFNRAILPEGERDPAAADDGREDTRPAAAGARRRARPQPEPARGAFHRRRSQCRQHSCLGAAGADRHVSLPEGRRVAQELRRAAGGARGPPVAAGMSGRNNGNSASVATANLALGLGAIVLPSPFIGGRNAMAQNTPDTVVYVSNAASKEIYVLAMNRDERRAPPARQDPGARHRQAVALQHADGGDPRSPVSLRRAAQRQFPGVELRDRPRERPADPSRQRRRWTTAWPISSTDKTGR